MITNLTRCAVDFMEWIKAAPTAGQTLMAAGDNIVSRTHNGRKVSPTAFMVGVGGLVVFENAAGARRDVTASPGIVYPLQGIDGEMITVLDGTNTAADRVLLLYSGF